MVGRKRAVPDRGDVVWVTLAPEAGQEQSGRRPAVVLSPAGPAPVPVWMLVPADTAPTMPCRMVVMRPLWPL